MAEIENKNARLEIIIFVSVYKELTGRARLNFSFICSLFLKNTHCDIFFFFFYLSNIKRLLHQQKTFSSQERRSICSSCSSENDFYLLWLKLFSLLQITTTQQHNPELN